MSNVTYFTLLSNETSVITDQNLPAHSDTTAARMLVGNKCDLENSREVGLDEGKSLSESEGLFFVEASVLDLTNF
ncbi:hypothetical protein V6N12_061272 [Hibiscus sabdariffa]|uniref:Uncharacterized protein n=1 Tax=Hibiscus sabdariffa TaxID=183260 RepID=A0ABR2DWK3_9ROSI